MLTYKDCATRGGESSASRPGRLTPWEISSDTTEHHVVWT
jgi:hypothetical protein